MDMERTSSDRRGTVLFGKVFDGTLDPPLDDGAVVVEGERIAWVGPRERLPERYATPDHARIDRPGRSITPGLIDGHTHISFGNARSEEELALYTPVEYRAIRAAVNARRVLQAGVTSAFDAASTYDVAVNVRDAIDAGLVEGPRFVASGKQLTTHQGLEDSFPNNLAWPPGQAAVLIRNRDDLVEAVRYQVKDRVDCIKVSGSNDLMITPDSLDGAAFTLEEFRIVADETHRLGRICSVHARSRDACRDASKAGFDVLFHASYIDDEGIENCLRQDLTITPTLTFLANIVDAAEGSHASSAADGVKRELEAAVEALPRAYKAGVPLVCGSESGWCYVPYGDWHARELQLFVELLGMTPLQAIHAATLAATRCLKRFGHDVGKLEAGRYADLLVIDGDVGADVTLFQKKSRIDAILKGGRPVDRTPPPEPREWFFERHKLFLDGRLRYDEATGRGYVARR
ncbi:amidohydrolase family protein [Azospirillum sp. ST 5-10]|uniref:metal-dependent hydrolase family protein n=1 Tax=unclassified Azospirillum TaxID=2630922 RepID=UPI003F49C43A